MKTIRQRFEFFSIILFSLFLLFGCGGGSDATVGDADTQTGEVAISLTDAPGDFYCYAVDVTSVTLTKADGTEISVLPLATRIDFSQYTDMTEFLTIGTVPSGVYVAAALTLDYGNAGIQVEDDNGDTVPVDQIVDGDGNPVGELTMTVQLENRSHLAVVAGVPVHLLLDFNLEVTNQVSFDEGIPTLTVEPFLVADINRTGNKFHRVRGLLDDVSIDDGSFSVLLRPFYGSLSGNHHHFGIRSVDTGADTQFEVDGIQYTGEEGLAAMAQLNSLSPVVALGDLRFDPLRFEATQVYAGTSVPGGDMDVVEGNVISREDDLVTIKGATLYRAGSSVIFSDRLTVQLGDETIVTHQFSADTFDIDDISVGQRVVVFGQLTETDPEVLSLDADPGFVRMQITTVCGRLNAVNPSDPIAQLSVDLHAISHLPATTFDFTGTGSDPADDADPSDYQIDTSGMDLTSFNVDAPVKVRGFVQPFGQAPADFAAQTIIGIADVRALMRINWRLPAQTQFRAITAAGLVLDLSETGRFHHLVRNRFVADLTTYGQPINIFPQDNNTGTFVIRLKGAVQVYISFDEFRHALEGYVEDGAIAAKMGAVGTFDDATATLTADRIEICLK